MLLTCRHRNTSITARAIRARGWVRVVGIEDKYRDTFGEWVLEVTGLPPRRGLGTWPAASLV